MGILTDAEKGGRKHTLSLPLWMSAAIEAPEAVSRPLTPPRRKGKKEPTSIVPHAK